MTPQDIKARYRNKVGKVIIEVWNGEKWLYVKTLSNPLIEFNKECLAKVSLNTGQNTPKEPQKFAQDLLNEPLEKDIKQKAHEELNKLMGEILGKK